MTLQLRNIQKSCNQYALVDAGFRCWNCGPFARFPLGEVITLQHGVHVPSSEVWLMRFVLEGPATKGSCTACWY